MNKVMDWIKANVAIVACSAVILLILPAAWFGSSWWNKRIRTSREQAANTAMSELDRLRVSYVIPSLTPGGEAVTVPMDAPNAAATAFFKERRGTLEQQVGELGAVANEINRGGHKPLMDNFFPDPADKLLTLTFIETLVGKEQPSAYEQLLKKIGADGPADASKIAEVLNEEHAQAIERQRAEKGTDQFSPEEQDELAKTLARMRLSEYQRHARNVSVFATVESFPQAPRTVPPVPPDVTTCFDYQFDYWVIADLLNAIDAANRPDGRRGGVDKSVVKRIDRVTVEPLKLPSTSQDSMATGQPDAAPPAGLTGRISGGSNGLYDLRNAELTVVVSSARIPELLNAIARTNFMTVTSLSYEEIDPWADLEQGYFYGSEHVVRARMNIETVWLRSWTMPLMPAPIATALRGGEAPPAAEEQPPPPPPPAPVSNKSKPKTTKPPRR